MSLLSLLETGINVYDVTCGLIPISVRIFLTAAKCSYVDASVFFTPNNSTILIGIPASFVFLEKIQKFCGLIPLSVNEKLPNLSISDNIYVSILIVSRIKHT